MVDLLSCPFEETTKILNSHLLTRTFDDEGNGFPLKDALSCQHNTVKEGEEEIGMIVDALHPVLERITTRAPQWQDISTAPRDGTEIDILLNGNGAARIPNVKWGDDGVNHAWIDSYDNPVIHEGDPMNEITHWMPYPLSPEKETGQ